jgi:hypothetical protein
VIDNFTLALTHGLLLLAAWRVVFRPDLDDESAVADTDAARGEGSPPRA